jgi:hypothetical protein
LDLGETECHEDGELWFMRKKMHILLNLKNKSMRAHYGKNLQHLCFSDVVRVCRGGDALWFQVLLGTASTTAWVSDE